MTVDFQIDTSLNLDVIARYARLTESLTGIRYRDIRRGQLNGVDHNEQISILCQGLEPGSGRFKNQCTFIVKVDKDINTKVFNNGKMVNVGCKTPEHALQTAQILTESFYQLEGLLKYEVPSSFRTKNVKKFFKDDLRKKFSDLIQLLGNRLDLPMNLEPFNSAISSDEGLVLFLTELKQDPGYEQDLMYLYTIINILKSYYDERKLLEHYADSEFQELLTKIIEGTSDGDGGSDRFITGVFPAYLCHHNKILVDPERIDVVLINKSTNCGFYINRKQLVQLLEVEPRVRNWTFDKSRYPGVITVFKVEHGYKDVKIIFFNTGKINITAARSHDQIQIAYDFIRDFSRNNFRQLLLLSEYHNKIREYEDSLPDQFYVGVVDGQQYYLLKKSSIILNPHNVRVLKILGLLGNYTPSGG